ncbi:prolipoprotein diacylglyceryl transferase [Penaeicola halotolerans]|uniref:prolipoprotein diacylglyceryl transferase n=1 Tax=Penaeicola halotolerans TaxID=2793196 RepID=UPI001CF8BBEE|nr:prolipoprotein diacylglyceryl transferase [Penaeicola halotolerans]
MSFLSYIVWDPIPEVISGWSIPRWYSLLFALGFIISQQIMVYMFKKEGKKESDVDRLTIYMVIATILGARLGHVLFYEPDKYLSNPIDILKIYEGGLASHGAAIGILIALYLYTKKTAGQSFLWIVDRIVIVVAITAVLIRLGNLMNSEIGGKPTESDYGFVFARDAEDFMMSSKMPLENIEAMKSDWESPKDGLVPIAFQFTFLKGNYTEDQIKSTIDSNVKSMLTDYPYVRRDIAEPKDTPLNYDLKMDKGQYVATVYTWGIAKHPTQIYEALSYLAIFILLFGIWVRKKSQVPEGYLFGIFLVLLFGARFVWEYFKTNQVDFEDSLALNMGQILSIPLVLAGIVIFIYSLKKQKRQGTGS